jgi:hypothetical protein
MAMVMQLRRLGRINITVHGFRSFGTGLGRRLTFPTILPSRLVLTSFRTKPRLHTGEAMHSKGDAL